MFFRVSKSSADRARRSNLAGASLEAKLNRAGSNRAAICGEEAASPVAAASRVTVEWLESRVLMTTTNWNNDGGDFDFDNPANWSAGVPTAGVNAVINFVNPTYGNSPIVESDGINGTQADTMASLTCSLPFINSGVTLTVTGSAQFSNSLDIDNFGSLKGATLSLTGTGSLTSDDGTGILDGVTLASNVALAPGNSLSIQDGLTLTNNAVVTLNGSSAGGSGLAFEGPTQSVAGTGEILFAGGTTGSTDLTIAQNANTSLTINSGVKIDGGGGAILWSTGISDETLVNQGTISADVSGQTININTASSNGGTVSNSGTLSAINGGKLIVTGLTGNIGGNVSATGSGGVLSLSGSNFTVNAGLTAGAGTTLTLGGTWTNASASTISVTGGATATLGGTWTNDGTISSANSTVNLAGSFEQSSTASITETNSTVNLTGTYNAQGNPLAFTSTTGSWSLDGGTIENATISFSGSGTLNLTAVGGTLEGDTLNSDLIVSPGESLDVEDGLTLSNATIDLSAGSPTAILDFISPVVGTDTPQTLGGTGEVLLAGGGSLQVDSSLTIGANILIDGGGGRIYRSETNSQVLNLINNGTISADVASETLDINCSGLAFQNHGVIEAAPGTIQLDLQSSFPSPFSNTGGTLEVGIGGTSPGVTYGQINALGAPLPLSGTLKAILLNGFVPAGAATFTVLTYPSETGAFTTLSLTPTGASFTAAVNSATLVLTNAGTAPKAPEVTGVSVHSTLWSSTFPYVNGYPIPTGAPQLADLPWINLNEVSITFNQPVNVAQGDLTVDGVNTPVYSMGGFTYNPSNFTATWTLASPIGDDKLLLNLSGTGSTAVTATSGGTPLDGTFTNGVSTFPSGANAPGTNFKFDINVLPGDVRQTTGGPVTILDVVLVRNAQLTTPASNGYSPLYDVDGNGTVNILDVIDVRNRQLTSLPSGTPAIASASAAASQAIATPQAVIVSPAKPTSTASVPVVAPALTSSTPVSTSTTTKALQSVTALAVSAPKSTPSSLTVKAPVAAAPVTASASSIALDLASDSIAKTKAAVKNDKPAANAVVQVPQSYPAIADVALASRLDADQEEGSNIV